MPKNNEIRNFEKQQNQQTKIIRLAKESDLPDILAIEQASFLQPWTESAFRNEFKNSYSRLWLLEERALVIGYICAWFVSDEGQIANVAVLPEYRHRGTGKLLVQHVLQEARIQGVRSLSLEVRKSNIIALDLYRSFGFEKVAVRKLYYENGEDALLMSYDLSRVYRIFS